MSPSQPLVVALVTDGATAASLAAAFEEEGVPLTVAAADEAASAPAHGSVEALAREASGRALLGIGIGGNGERLALVLAGAAGRAYLTAPAAAARSFGCDAARIAARRPLRSWS